MKAVLADYPQAAEPVVEELTGRPAMTYEQWAREHSEMFRREIG